jgi:hypothetical protein
LVTVVPERCARLPSQVIAGLAPTPMRAWVPLAPVAGCAALQLLARGGREPTPNPHETVYLGGMDPLATKQPCPQHLTADAVVPILWIAAPMSLPALGLSIVAAITWSNHFALHPWDTLAWTFATTVPVALVALAAHRRSRRLDRLWLNIANRGQLFQPDG